LRYFSMPGDRGASAFDRASYSSIAFEQGPSAMC
jgi:hypothetical protein